MPRRLRHRRGAALLSAMLTVTLVATFAAAALWQQWRSVEVEAAERTRVQSGWILTGALDWARLILRADALSGSPVDHLGEPWAVPLEESRLSSFLAADKDNSGGQSTDEAFDAFLSGSITDLQSKLNLRNLFESGKTAQLPYDMFTRLFELLGLPESELSALAENLRRAWELSSNAEEPDAPVPPSRVEQLGAYGLSPATLKAIEPYVTLLPQVTTAININTASAVVLAASDAKLSLPDAERLVAARANRYFKSTTEASTVLGKEAGLFVGNYFGVASKYFEVRGRLRLEAITLEERSMVQRDGTGAGTLVKTLWRERTVSDERALAAAATTRP